MRRLGEGLQESRPAAPTSQEMDQDAASSYGISRNQTPTYSRAKRKDSFIASGASSKW